VFSLDIFFENLEIKPALLYSDMHSLVGSSLIPKYVTLNDLECLFRVKFCFRAYTSSVGLGDRDFQK